MEFEWDSNKAAANLRKHGVPFEEAKIAFGDPAAKLIFDEDHSDSEERFRLTGISNRGRLLVITLRYDGGVIRIINARRATKREIESYEKDNS